MRAVTTNATLSPNAFNSLDGFVDTTSRIYVRCYCLEKPHLLTMFSDATPRAHREEYIYASQQQYPTSNSHVPKATSSHSVRLTRALEYTN